MAHWIIEDHGFAGSYYKCSNCGEIYTDLFDYSKISKGYCPSCTRQINDDENEYVDNAPKFTNLNYIHSLSPAELAPLLIHPNKVDDWDYDWDENLYPSGEHNEYITSDAEIFYNYDDALAYEIKWLNTEYKENNK